MAEIFYHAVPTDWRKEQKYRFLDDHEDVSKIEWKEVKPDKHFNWLTEGMSEDFESFLPLGSKEGGEETIFTLFSNGVKTNRDVWTWNFSREALAVNIERTVETYNEHLSGWQRRKDRQQSVDDFVTYDKRISWSESLKNRLKRGTAIDFNAPSVRVALYRPFTQQCLYFDSAFAERRYQFPVIFPTTATEQVNRVICLSDAGSRSPFSALAVSRIPEVHFLASSDAFQCFPFYTYAEDGTQRRENITDWALQEFQTRYPSSPDTRHSPLTKWDIFHYVYAVLHHPEYRARYAANLRRELPRIPFVGQAFQPAGSGDFPVPSSSKSKRPRNTELESSVNRQAGKPALQGGDVFWQFAAAGKRLAELHVNYEQQPEYPLERIEKPGEKLNWRVEKMRLSKDKSALLYNDFLTLSGIPKETFDYRLGNRSALEWVIDQYQVSTDKRSGITNDPNRPDDPEYIVRLLGQVITVSLETVKVVNGLPHLEK